MNRQQVAGLVLIVGSLSLYGWVNRDYIANKLESRVAPADRIARDAGSPAIYAPWPYEKADRPSGDDDIALTPEQKQSLVAMAYEAIGDTLTGTARQMDWDPAFNGPEREVHAVLRRDAEVIGEASDTASNVLAAAYGAAVLAMGPAPHVVDSAERDAVQIHLYVSGDESPFGDYNRRRLETGLSGMRVYIDGERRADGLPGTLVERNEDLLTWASALCVAAGLDDACSGPGQIARYQYDAVHFGATRFSDKVVTFYRAGAPDMTPDLSREKVQASFDLGLTWLRDNLNAKGFFNYEYTPADESYSTANNLIRQMMPARLLAELARTSEIDNRLHQKNIEYILSAWYRERGDEGYLVYGNNSKLGTNGIALRTLTWSPAFESHRSEAEHLANGIVGLMAQDGSFNPWYIRRENAGVSDKRLLYFYSGEALLGLVEYYEKTGDTRWLDAARRSQDHYLIEYVEQLGKNYYPAYVPWHTMSLCKLFRITGDVRYADAVFTLNDKLLEIQQDAAGDEPDLLGRFYNPRFPQYGTPHASSTGVYMDGLTYAVELARERGDTERAERYRRAIVLAVHNLINLQFKGSDMYYIAHPERVKGAIRADVLDNRIRVDTTQHALDGMLRALTLFSEDDWRLDEAF